MKNFTPSNRSLSDCATNLQVSPSKERINAQDRAWKPEELVLKESLRELVPRGACISFTAEACCQQDWSPHYERTKTTKLKSFVSAPSLLYRHPRQLHQDLQRRCKLQDSFAAEPRVPALKINTAYTPCQVRSSLTHFNFAHLLHIRIVITQLKKPFFQFSVRPTPNLIRHKLKNEFKNNEDSRLLCVCLGGW
ncbi:hypothetical protein M758_UG165500 [Ceratodon purpureus]|nr:hypothetical protein M758_UG165500 [Ceratodon purpureus]